MPDASPAYLRRLLRESGVLLEPLVEGVRQRDFAELERTLLGLADVYGQARDAGDRARAGRCRELVIEARGHALMAARRARDNPARAAKREMAEWMLVWLEDPEVFRSWVPLRKRRMG